MSEQMLGVLASLIEFLARIGLGGECADLDVDATRRDLNGPRRRLTDFGVSGRPDRAGTRHSEAAGLRLER